MIRYISVNYIMKKTITMKQLWISIMATMLMSMVGTKASAYDIAVKNADGKTIYYNYINNGTELMVTRDYYSGVVNIPETVTYMNRTRNVTAIGNSAFFGCDQLTSVTIPNSVTAIGNSAFMGCDQLTSMIIPNSVTTIGNSAFSECRSLTTVNIPNSMTSIVDFVFEGCSALTSISISNSVTSIGNYAFHGCSALSSLTIGNSVMTIGEYTFASCYNLTSVTIPNSVMTIGEYAFSECFGLISLTIGNSVTTIGNRAFYGCRGLTSVTIPNSVTSIGNYAFHGCNALTSVTIPNSVTTIGEYAFSGADIPTVISLIREPFVIFGKTSSGSTFSQNTFNNATLYVPKGTVDKYKATKGWKDFLFIEEGTGEGGITTPQKCKKPTIRYQNGKLTFNCETEGAVCHSTITDTDIKSYSDVEVLLSVTYNISVYATKAGYENSETATATLCWIDVDPKTEGIENGIAQMRANPVLIQANNGQITVIGAENGTNIATYSVSGQMVALEHSNGAETTLFTNLKRGEVAIVKIGEKSVKVVMQ